MKLQPLPPLNSLVAFEASARHLSFTVAARELNVTQGAISRQIRVLEDYLGKTLFERTTRRLTLTSALALSLAGCAVTPPLQTPPSMAVMPAMRPLNAIRITAPRPIKIPPNSEA